MAALGHVATANQLKKYMIDASTWSFRLLAFAVW
jgi:hypothetical protein